ncbi:MAG: hypothetical protein LCI00_19990 [Chloroflexi bacterium]|nr:hypothetical protein [Chloroflexota bacterium]MCC6891473.1 hypothetical protein [Anaerolineae bacterium]
MPFSVLILCAFASLRLCVLLFVFARPAKPSRASAELSVGGGYTGAICRMSAISAVIAEPPAVTESPLGGITGAVRPPFQRMVVQLTHFVHFANNPHHISKNTNINCFCQLFK